MRGKWLVGSVVMAVAIVGTFFQVACAYRFSSTDYIIDASVANNFGGTDSSSDYQLVGSGGESAIGNGASGSYATGIGYVSQLQKSLALTLQPSGLVGYWPYEEGSGTQASDQSANSNNGQFVNSSTIAWGTGKIGQAVTFSNQSTTPTTGSYIDYGDDTSVQLGSTVTLETWVKTTAAPDNWQTLVAKDYAYGLFLYSAPGVNKAYASGRQMDSGSAVCTDSTVIISDGTWHHLAITIQSGVTGGTKLYVDGVLRQTCTSTIVSQGYDVTTGALPYLGSINDRYSGTLDEVKLFSRALSAGEIAAEYAAQSAGIPNGVSLGTIIPGTSNTVLANAVVQTDADGYSLAINENNDLTSGSYTIPAISSGTIASPAAWTEGTTKGLGFTLTATNATAIPGAWSGGSKYAAIPTTATTTYTRTGTQSSKDYLTLQFRADVLSTQRTTSTPYTNTVTVTGTMSL